MASVSPTLVVLESLDFCFMRLFHERVAWPRSTEQEISFSAMKSARGPELESDRSKFRPDWDMFPQLTDFGIFWLLFFSEFKAPLNRLKKDMIHFSLLDSSIFQCFDFFLFCKFLESFLKCFPVSRNS